MGWERPALALNYRLQRDRYLECVIIILPSPSSPLIFSPLPPPLSSSSPSPSSLHPSPSLLLTIVLHSSQNISIEKARNAWIDKRGGAEVGRGRPRGEELLSHRNVCVRSKKKRGEEKRGGRERERGEKEGMERRGDTAGEFIVCVVIRISVEGARVAVGVAQEEELVLQFFCLGKY